MAVKLNRSALDHAQRLVETGDIVRDERAAWDTHRPSPEDEDTFIREHGIGEYAHWHLGIDDAEAPESKRRYTFLFGDFRNLHRCAVLDARSRAGGAKHFDIEAAAAVLLRSVDALA